MRSLLTLILALILVVPVFAAVAQDVEKVSAARAAVQARNYEEAVAAIGEPGAPEERYWLGRAMVEMQRTDEAEAQFQAMMESGESSEAFEGLARVFIARKNYDQAVANAARAVELNGERADAHYVLGLAHIYKQNFDAAAPSLQRSLDLDPSNGYTYYQLGLVQYRQKRYDQTIRNFTKFVEMMPNAPEAAQVRSILRTLR